MVWVRERTISTERPPLVGEVIANFLWIEGRHVVSVTDPYGRILGFLDRSRYFFYQVAPQLYSLVVSIFRNRFNIAPLGTVPDRKSILLWATAFRETGSVQETGY
jgi:hypothetical protein